MPIKEQLQEDLKAAMKGGDAPRRDVLRLINAAIRQVEVDERKTLDDQELVMLLTKEAKKRRDSIAEAEKLGRQDIVQKEQYELGVIESYLPRQLSREEIEAEVRKAIAEAGATSAKEMGNVMKVLMPRVKGLADSKLVNEVVRTLLGG